MMECASSVVLIVVIAWRRRMIGRQERWQEDLFVVGPLGDLVPDDHILRKIDHVLDLSWLRSEVADLYDAERGRPGIDPEAAVRLMLAGLLEGIVHDRKLMRQAQVNLAIRWFAGYRLTETLPDHSSLTRIRQRWGEQRFQRLFNQIVQQCVKAGLVKGDIAHIDATLIRADVSWESLVQRHWDEVKAANPEVADDAGSKDKDDEGDGRPSRSHTGQVKKISPTDPDATMATSCKQYRMEPCYKQHTAVDDQAGVIVDVQVTTGEASEGHEFAGQLDRFEQATGKPVQSVTSDGAYGHGANFTMLEDRQIEAIIPPQKPAQRSSKIPAQRFKYDAANDVVRCPEGKVLRRGSRAGSDRAWMYRARTRDCRACPRREQCVPPSASARLIRISIDQPALLRARRRHRRWSTREKDLYNRHRWRSEGVHAEAKTQHGLRRAVRRRLWNVRIQAYLTAAVINLKRLAALLRWIHTRHVLITVMEAVRQMLRRAKCVHSRHNTKDIECCY
jgi:transposase